MPNLYVRHVPEELYQRIQDRARAQGRSISAEVVSLLTQAIEGSDNVTAEVLAGIRRRRFFRPNEASAPNSATLLR